MPPTAKDLELSTNAQPAGASGAGKAQPVALEVPVTVNGARTVEGSDKREPFSETTETVLVFGNGAVIRLASNVTPGQLLFLTNEKTKKGVVCQVLKSKNYSNVSGYVELEFTEQMAGFWGVRFPEAAPKQANIPASAPVSDATKAPVPPAVVPSASAPKIVAPAPVSTTSNLPKPTPMAVVPSAIPSITPSVTTLPKAPVAPVASKPVVAPPAATNAQSSNEALKRESLRLQEQLSSMQFHSQAPSAVAPPSGPNKASSEAPSKVIEMGKPQPPARTAPPVSVRSSSASLEADEVKIPSWLEPLARNAAMHGQNDLATREEAEQVIEFEVQDVSAPATTKETALVAPPEATLDVVSVTEIPFHEQRQSAKGGSNKMILIAAAAAGFVLLAAGGTWYARQSGKATENTVASTFPVASVATETKAVAQPAGKSAAEAPASAPAASFNSAAVESSPVASAPVNSQPVTPTAQPLRGASEKISAAELSAYKRLAEPQPQPAVQPAAKKPSIGNVTLAAPAARRTTATAPGEADLAPSIGGGQVVPTGDAMGGGLAGGGMKPTAPAAPLPVGGDVKQARLISSTPPLYPALAKAQHVEGAVHLDALVDEHGRVLSVKVINGPTLLHQAATDAIRQWKYQPATLDGKPVPMHLTVTLQFKLQ
jgi:protein TonB